MQGIYVHFPFCIRKCSYCDFISFPLDNHSADIDKYLAMLLKETKMRSSEIASLDDEITIFFGGGTPTSIDFYKMKDFIKNFKSTLFNIKSTFKILEFTCEANPGTVDRIYLQMLFDAGVNRLSMGFQSLKESELKVLERLHDERTCISAFKDARDAGFRNINIDIMFGTPDQTASSLEQTLSKVLELGPEHISAYSLILEEGTKLFDEIERNEYSLPEEDNIMAMHYMLLNKLSSKGYSRYEISNFALNGNECLHNLMYWENGYYIGLGCAAHSHPCTYTRKANTNDLYKYIEGIDNDIFPDEREELSSYREASDSIILGLRTIYGVDLSMLSKKFDIDLLAKYKREIEMLVEKGLIFNKKGLISLTEQGFYLGNLVFSEFLA